MQPQRSWACALMENPVVQKTGRLPYVHFSSSLLFPQAKIYLETLGHNELNSACATPMFTMCSLYCLCSLYCKCPHYFKARDYYPSSLSPFFGPENSLEFSSTITCCSKKDYLSFNMKPMISTSFKDVALCHSTRLKIASFKRNV